MKKLLACVIACVIPFAVTHACTAFYKSELVSGLNKVCYYDHLGSTVAYNVKSHQLCPLNINVPH